jgi:hypothetical protein
MLKMRKLISRFICFELILIFLLASVLLTTERVLSSDVSVTDSDKKKAQNNMDKVALLVKRAMLFDRFLDESDWASYGELVKDQNYQKKGSINLAIFAVHMESPPSRPEGKYVNYKEIIPYLVVFGNKIAYENEDGNEESITGHSLHPMMLMAFRNSGDKREIASYVEYASTYNTEILFYKNVRPQSLQHRYYDKKKGIDYDNTTEIDWDESGKITLSNKLDQMQKLPPLVTKLSPNVERPRRLPVIKLRTIKDQKILRVLQRAENISGSKNFNELLECSKELPLFDKKKDHPSIEY